MADTQLGADSARENPDNAFIHARALYEMAVADMRDAQPDFETDCVLTLYCGSATDAADALLTVPAPDITALAHKLEIVRDEETHRRDDFDEVLNALIADVRRLAGEA